jgi:multicomponent K+:H+ antiporter subunit A
MTNLFWPLLICLVGALAAGVYGWPALNRRQSITRFSWLLAVFPFGAFVVLVWLTSQLNGAPLTASVPWLPTLGLSASLYYDSFSALFALLVAGIGVLVMIYGGYYLKGDNYAWRFQFYMLLFMVAMLGVVMAGDVITLFVFWELTSITSFLIIAHKTKDDAARRGAFRALFITGGGGIALLAGLLFMSTVSGSTEYTVILNSGAVLKHFQYYPVILILIAFGAFTKSAQFPAHIWLPGAMSAPTPASAYLHSATMVNAGIYLMARLHPALGGTEWWFWLLGSFGLLTMLVGAYVGVKQNDLKALLAYSTIAQLGVLMLLIGQDLPEAFKAMVIGVLAHAFYKSALFMAAGIVDHEAGTRDLRRLGGLRKTMPPVFVVAALAGLSMAGLPPMLGFLAKETLLGAAVLPTASSAFDLLLTVAAVVAGSLLLLQAGIFVIDTFLGKPRDPSVHPHKPPIGMWLAPAIPAALSLLIGIAPEPQMLESFLSSAASSAYGGTVKVSLDLFHGINGPLVLGLVAIGLGIVLLIFRARVRAVTMAHAGFSFNRVYDNTLRGIDCLAYFATRLQAGHLRHYLAVMLIAVAVLIVLFGALPPLEPIDQVLHTGDGLAMLRGFALLLALVASAATIVLRRDFWAILAMTVSGLSVAILMALEPAPDVALVQIVVDILSAVILVLVLTRLPRVVRLHAAEVTYRQGRSQLARDAIVAIGAGIIVGTIVLTALTARPRESAVTPYYEQSAKPLTDAADIVGAIVVDFRGFDTLIEITVFSMAGIGVYLLLRYASRTASDVEPIEPRDLRRWGYRTRGIVDPRTSSFVRLAGQVVFPLALILAAVQILFGASQPGDGFTAGVIISLAVSLLYIVSGYEETKRRLPWLRPLPLIEGGILLAIANASSAALLTGSFFAPVDFGKLLSLPLPANVHLSTATLFELAICLSVLGSAALILDTLGRPRDADRESTEELHEIEALAQRGEVTSSIEGSELVQS